MKISSRPLSVLKEWDPTFELGELASDGLLFPSRPLAFELPCPLNIMSIRYIAGKMIYHRLDLAPR